MGFDISGRKLIALIDSELFTNLPRPKTQSGYPEKLAVDFDLSDFINGHGDTRAVRCSIPYPPFILAFFGVLCKNLLGCMHLKDVSLLAYGLHEIITI